jgi:predicted nucleic acid-binding Zn ribbon protein
VLRDMDISGKVKNWQVVEKWESLVGQNIARHAKAVSVDSENLFVMVDNPVWQSQLFMMKSRILDKIRALDVRIRDIKFMISDTPITRRGHEKER